MQRYRLLTLISCLVLPAFWQPPGQAQSTCYFVDTKGQVINSAHLCQRRRQSIWAHGVKIRPNRAKNFSLKHSNSWPARRPIIIKRSNSRRSFGLTITNNSAPGIGIHVANPKKRTRRIRSVQNSKARITTINPSHRHFENGIIRRRDRVIIRPNFSTHGKRHSHKRY